MPAFIVKPTRDRDFYVRWSTVVDDVTACGSRAELTEYLAKFSSHGEADPARFDRADETGSSGKGEAAGWFGWDDDTFHLGQYEEPRAVKRADLEAYAVARCSDGEMDAAVEHTYVWADQEEGEDARPAAPTGPATPPVGEETSGGAGGAQIGAGETGLGDAMRHIALGLRENILAGWDLTKLADQADALEREVASARASHEAERRALLTANRELAKVDAQVERVRALLAGGPDTPCRTTWPDGLECVEVPVADIRAALDGGTR